ncbi:MAG: hypothetical protein HN368_12075, partial [Spirochaetales bacterium]|nr:hypothetical protein [Spirochaetales bacterium]
MKGFTMARLPALAAGPGSFNMLLDKLRKTDAHTYVVITGGSSFRSGQSWSRLTDIARGSGGLRDY